MKRLLLIITAILTLINVSVIPVSADPNGKMIAEKGNNKGATACVACHGSQGEGNPAAAYPYLAGLPVEYIKHQLKGFRDGTRKNPIMKPIASSLSDKEIDAVASYFSSLKNPLLARKLTAKTKAEKLGQQLAEGGKWQKAMPACFQCHGNNGQGIPPYFPPIHGQSYNYLHKQLQAWQNGSRSNDHLDLMQEVVSKLTPNEMQAVSQYLSVQ